MAGETRPWRHAWRIGLVLGLPLLAAAQWPPIDHHAPVDQVRDLAGPVQLRLAPVAGFRFVTRIVVRKGQVRDRIRFEGRGRSEALGDQLRWHLRLERIVDGDNVTQGAPLIDVEMVTNTAGESLGTNANLRNLPRNQDEGSPGLDARWLGRQWLQTIKYRPFALPKGPVAAGDPFISLGAYLGAAFARVEGLELTEPLAPSRLDGMADLHGRRVLAGHLDDAFSVQHPRGHGRIHAAGYALVDVETGLMLDALVHFTGNLTLASGPTLRVDYEIHSQISFE
ncbi:MAG: hypothetical protein H6907_16265 [Hyphomicrobiales bacterium]|nr:hypothetical protein [Hyphomicrobiales bacterium]MCP5373281.1 hypothetical protein [Hyphomicrobiales bacterium]